MLNKTMDGDLGGEDGQSQGRFNAPYTDTSNGYASAIALISNMMLQHHSDAWTNEVPMIITPFGRDANFVAYGAYMWGRGDRVFRGEQEVGNEGWDLDHMVDMIRESQAENKNKYGRSFSFIIVPEGALIKGISHRSEIVDAHKKRYLAPENLAHMLKVELKKKGLSTHTIPITYEMRNLNAPDHPYSLDKDYDLARQSGDMIVEAILNGADGLETTINIDVPQDEVTVGLAPIRLVTQQRLTKFSKFPWFDENTFKVKEEFERYYRPLLGEPVPRGQALPRKPMVVNIYEGKG